MKKFIIAVDGLKYSLNTYKTAVYFAKQAGAHLLGVFLEDMAYHSYKIYDLVPEEDDPTTDKLPELEEGDWMLRNDAVEQFERVCEQADVDYTIHRDRNTAINELLNESVFADLILINSSETLNHYYENKPTRIIRALLSDAQCPVLIIPEDYQVINSLVFLYDGTASSVQAIRTFSYLFPGLMDKNSEVVTVNNKMRQAPIPNARLMKEFMKRHFPKARYLTIEGIAENEIVKHFKSTQNNLLVLGANGRGNISRWMKRSLADILIQELRLPLFISHI
jgi:hypothetical protein